MAFIPGTSTRYYVGPQRFSVAGKSLTTSTTTAQLDVSSFEDKAMVYLNGQQNGSVSLELMMDTAYATTSQFTTINTWATTPQPITVGFDGVANSAVVWMILGNQSSVTYSAPVADIVTASVSVQPDGPMDLGYVIATEAAVTSTTNGTAIDLTAASTNGGVVHVHTTAFAGLTSNVVTVEGSANGTTGWALVTGATSATISAVGSERITIAAGTAVPRYLRVVDTVVGTGSTTRIVSFARR